MGSDTVEELKEVRISNIHVNPFQPRRQFSEVELLELAESIKSVGIIHPPVVRPRDASNYELISGERRFRAAQLAGFSSIPVLVRKCSEKLSAQAALIENIQRVDLNPLEIAKALKQLIDQSNLSQEELAKKVGKKRSTVANYLRLLALPKEIQSSLECNQISMGHAKAILSVDCSYKQKELHQKVLVEQLSVRQTELAAQKQQSKDKGKVSKKDIYLDKITELLELKMGTKVNVIGSGEKGSIHINYYNLDDLDRLLLILGVNIN